MIGQVHYSDPQCMFLRLVSASFTGLMSECQNESTNMTFFKSAKFMF